MKEDGSHWTGKQARETLGAVAVEVFTSQLRANASKVEDGLQSYMQETLELHYPRRLFRHIAKGIKREDEETKAGGVVLHKVFLTIFKIVEGSEMWHEEEKTYPKSVMFENKDGKQTRVFIQA